MAHCCLHRSIRTGNLRAIPAPSSAAPMTTENNDLRDRFLAWQCLIRQYGMRNAQGQPSPAMQPVLSWPEQTTPAVNVNVLILKLEPQSHTAEMRHIVRKSHDPRERYESALRYLSETYFQRSREFSDQMTALFALDSPVVRQLLDTESCNFDFEEKSQRYTIPCQTRELPVADPNHQATYWHNAMFNPTLPGQVKVMSFIPVWAHAHSDGLRA